MKKQYKKRKGETKMKGTTILSTFIGTVAGAIGGAAVAGNTMGKSIKQWKALSDKHLSLFLLMNEWMKTKQEGKEIADFFKQEEYNTVAIYGMSYVGERVYDELKGAGIDVKYAIDRNAATIYSDIPLYTPEDDLPEVDVIVVTAVAFYEEIRDMLSERVEIPIVSFEDILYEI